MNHNKIEFRKVRDFGGILNVTFEYIRTNFKVLFLSNLYISAPAILLAGVFLGLYESSIFNFSVGAEIQQFGIPFLLSMIFMMISYLIVMVVTYSHLVAYQESETGTPITIEEVWKKTKQNFFLILFTGLGYSVIIGIVIILFVALGFYLVSQGNTVFILLVLFGIGLAIYLSINYSFIFIIRIQEGLRFTEALRRSKDLISNNWWFTFGLVFVVGLIQGFLMYALYIPTYIVMFFVAFTGLDFASSGLARILLIITSVITSLSVIFYMISTLAISFHYYNRVERKEAPGLLQKVESIK